MGNEYRHKKCGGTLRTYEPPQKEVAKTGAHLSYKDRWEMLHVCDRCRLVGLLLDTTGIGRE